MFNRDIDSLILMKLDDEDLERLNSDPAYKNVLDNDMFWRQRTINRFESSFEPAFGSVSEGEEKSAISLLEKYAKQYAKNWREYYISLVDFMEHIYKDESILEYYAKQRSDLLNLIDVARINREEIEGSIEEQTDEWKTWILEVVVNPNVFNLFFNINSPNLTYGKRDKYIKYAMDGFKYLLNAKDKRIQPYLLLPILFYIECNEYEEISEVISLTLNDPRITIEDIEDSLSDIDDIKSINHYVMDEYLNFMSTKLSLEENNRFLRRIIEYIR